MSSLNDDQESITSRTSSTGSSSTSQGHLDIITNDNVLDIELKAPDQRIETTREVLDLESFSSKAGRFTPEKKKKSEQISSIASSLCGRCTPFGFLSSLLPIVVWLPKYSAKSSLLPDAIAGVTVAILRIPQGIAYSLLAGLGPVNGLYVSFFPQLIYVLMGSSRHLSLGTFAIASIMLNQIATKMGAVNNETLSDAFEAGFDGKTLIENGEAKLQTIEVLTSVCLLCGFIQLGMGALRLGSLSLIMSEHLVSAFSTAIAFHVATSQFPYIFGFDNLPKADAGAFTLINSWIIIFQHIKSTNWYSIIFSVITIGALVGSKDLLEPRLKKWISFPIPFEILIFIITISMSWAFKIDQNLKIAIVKTVPTGLPKPAIPRFDIMPALFVDSLILALVCYVVSLSLAKIFARKNNYPVDPNQELIALGASNVFASFFLSYTSSGALSRTSLQEKVGGKTQIAGAVSCVVIMTVLLFLAPLLYHLPKFVLSCIVLVALKSMFLQVKEFKMFWVVSKIDGIVWLVTFFAVIILNIDLGLIAGIFASILTLLFRLAMPKMQWLGRLSSTEIYAEVSAYNELYNIPGTQIVRLGQPLFYLNAETYKDKILAAASVEHSLLGSNNKKTLVIDMSAVTFIDKSGIDTLVEVIQILQEQEVLTCLAACPVHIVTSLEGVKFNEKVEHSSYPCRIYPTIHDAMIASSI